VDRSLRRSSDTIISHDVVVTRSRPPRDFVCPGFVQLNHGCILYTFILYKGVIGPQNGGPTRTLVITAVYTYIARYTPYTKVRFLSGDQWRPFTAIMCSRWISGKTFLCLWVYLYGDFWNVFPIAWKQCRDETKKKHKTCRPRYIAHRPIYIIVSNLVTPR